jgi:hypothetical protein
MAKNINVGANQLPYVFWTVRGMYPKMTEIKMVRNVFFTVRSDIQWHGVDAV